MLPPGDRLSLFPSFYRAWFYGSQNQHRSLAQWGNVTKKVPAWAMGFSFPGTSFYTLSNLI
jgi:hypothetical protein